VDLVIETVAVIAFALYGVLRGLRKGFDAVGLISVAFAVTFGGGTEHRCAVDISGSHGSDQVQRVPLIRTN